MLFMQGAGVLAHSHSLSLGAETVRELEFSLSLSLSPRPSRFLLVLRFCFSELESSPAPRSPSHALFLVSSSLCHVSGQILPGLSPLSGARMA
mmetsp:Transcript_4744/g.11063  ORF Transcript_4744/g.11063 Transcript_4744/m.11063 type:complete len:93 (-) Transcript_4744:36-314(-)